MSKLTLNVLANRQDATDAKLDQITAILQQLATGTPSIPPTVDAAPPEIQGESVQASPLPDAVRLHPMAGIVPGSPAEAKANREFVQRRVGPRIDDKMTEHWVPKKDRAGNIETETKNGVETPKKEKITVRLEEDTRKILAQALATDFAGLALGVLTPQQLAVLQDAGCPVNSPYVLPVHKQKSTGNLGFGKTDKMTFFLTDRKGNNFEFSTGAGVWMNCIRAYLNS